MTPDPNQLAAIAHELASREPIFHRPEHGTDRADFENLMAESFWEVGASGQKYSREFVLTTLKQRAILAGDDDFIVADFVCQCIALDTYLVTYQLTQKGGRLSRRATLWRADAGGWKILYHQGTLITAGSW
jgi:hypothetical protein